jgi:ribosome-associated translation inhibitor RaiA
MKILIRSPHLKIRQGTLDSIKKKVLSLSHLNGKISKAEVFLIEEGSLKKQKKVCNIMLYIDDTLFVHKTGDDFEEAATAAVRTLKRRVNRSEKLRGELSHLRKSLRLCET